MQEGGELREIEAPEWLCKTGDEVRSLAPERMAKEGSEEAFRVEGWVFLKK